MAVSRVAKTVARKIAKNKTVKVNSNPNKTRAKGERNPTQNKLTAQAVANVLGNKYPPVKSNTIKINSSIPKRRGK